MLSFTISRMYVETMLNIIANHTAIILKFAPNKYAMSPTKIIFKIQQKRKYAIGPKQSKTIYLHSYVFECKPRTKLAMKMLQPKTVIPPTQRPISLPSFRVTPIMFNEKKHAINTIKACHNAYTIYLNRSLKEKQSLLRPIEYRSGSANKNFYCF